MFLNLSHLGHPPEYIRPRDVPPPTPIRFPALYPDPNEEPSSSDSVPLTTLLRGIQRPTDVKLSHLSALRLHVIPQSPPSALIPDPSYLPQEEWTSIPADDLEDADPATIRPLNNGRFSPGAKIYRERIKELSVDNAAAFRTIRRLPQPPGQKAARLGNAYEFFKNLELLSGFWLDTSLPPGTQEPESNQEEGEGKSVPLHQQIHQRTGAGNQTPPDFRASMLTALVKLVAYDFGCNVSLPRVEPRLQISSSSSSSSSSSPTHTPSPNVSTSTSPVSSTSSSTPSFSFPSALSLIYRTPTDRSSARAGIVEGPLAVLSARPQTLFATPAEEILDLSREVVAILVTAQQRAREGGSEKRPDENAWWCHKPRWGGGTGGPIGREEGAVSETDDIGDSSRGSQDPSRADLGDDSAPNASPPHKRSRKTMSIYDSYRMIRPPSSTWDRKAKYLSIGRVPGADYDDVFLISALNHHVCVVRTRVPDSLLHELAGEVPGEGGGDGKGREGGREREREETIMWRSRWFDMFLVKDRVEAMHVIWGVMGWLMRVVESNEEEGDEGEGGKEGGEKMEE